MTPQQALQLLNEAVASMSLPRGTHMELVEAVNTLNTAITPADELEPAVF